MTADLFHRLVAEGESGLANLVEVRQQEGVQLEFKTKANPDHGRDDKEDRKNLGQALSGFSNSMGGLLVWGIEAKANDDKVDCATSLKPIRQIERFKSRVTSLVGDLLTPKNDDIHVEAVPSANFPGSGYVLVYIGRSERRPHRSEAPNDGRYYKRSGDSFYAMEHYDIEDSFKRQATPMLSLAWDIRNDGSVGDEKRLKVRIGLQNDGVVSGRYPYISVTELRDYRISQYGLDGNGSFGLPWHRSQTQFVARFAGGADYIVHPSTTLLVFAIGIGVLVKPNEKDYELGARTVPLIAKLAFGCDGMPTQRETIEIFSSRLVHNVLKGSDA